MKIITVLLLCLFLTPVCFADFTTQQETILKAVANKYLIEYQLDMLQKDDKDLSDTMNGELGAVNTAYQANVDAVRDLYDPQIATIKASIIAKEQELEDLLV